jgi:branched-chain amino acid aminotransferase
MFTADYVNGQWDNLSVQPYAHLQMLPGTCVLHYGQSVFEGLKAYRNDQGDVLVFRPEMNARRLNASAERLCIPTLPEEIFMAGLNELLQIDRDWVPNLPETSLYIRPFLFATDEYIGLRPSDNYKFIIFTCPVGAYYSKPVKVKIETHFSRTVEGGTGFAKAAGNYAGSLYPARLAQQKGYDQLIWTDGKAHEYIEEAGTMNLMFVIGDTLVTASPKDTILRGINRDSVLTLARDWGVKVEERPVSVREIVDAAKSGQLREAFGTGTAATITSIELVAYEEEEYMIPELNENSLTNRFLHELDAIKTGRKVDKYGWVYKV